MLAEAIRYIFTPCSKQSRSLGFLYNSIALQARARRCAASWASHHAQCYQVIRAAMDNCPGLDSVLICGSGLLLETPMDDVLARFGRVTCLDMVHPVGMRRRWPRERVRFVEADATGMLERIVCSLKAGRPADLAVPVPDPLPGEQFDLVVSCNLLSQLPLAPFKALSGRFGISQGELEELGRGLIQAHLDWLKSMPGSVCLIADIAREACDATGIREIEDALLGLELVGADRQWWWDIAPSGELGDGLSQRNLVVGAIDARRVLARPGSGMGSSVVGFRGAE